MKRKLAHLRYLFLLCVFSMFSVVLWAQENTESSETKTSTTTKSTDINITTNGDAWYMQPWVWIVGAAVFILLLVALLSGKRGRNSVTSDRVTVKKTVERDDTV